MGKEREKFLSAQDLEALPETRPLAQNVITARHVKLEDLLRLFDEEVHGKIRGAALQEGVTHVVCFENLDMWSSQLGARTALVVGSKQSFTLEKVLGTPYFRLGDVPSRFKYPVAYASVEALREALPAQGSAVQAAAS